MTDDDAQREALRRWGSGAIAVRIQGPLFPGGYSFQVGKRTTLQHGGDHVAILGIGETWEHAFKAADKRARRKDHDR